MDVLNSLRTFFTAINSWKFFRSLQEFFADVVHNTAEMIAKWQSVGFAHGE